MAGVAEVIGEAAPGQAGAGGRLHGDNPVVPLPAEHLAGEGGDEAAQVGAAAGAADDDVRLDAVLVQGDAGLQADDALVEQHLVQDRAEDVAVALLAGGGLDGLGDGAAQGPGGAGVLGEDLPADVGRVRRRRRHLRAVGAHDLPAEGLLLIGALDHVDLAVQAQVGAGHAQGRAPLAGAGLGGDAPEALVLGVVRLGDGRVQLVAAGGVVALELVVDLRRRAQLLLQAVGPDQRRGAVHLVKVADLLRDGDIGRGVVQLLADQFLAEDRLQLLGGHGLAGAGVQQRGGLHLHIGPDVVPGLGHLLLFQVDLIGDFRVGGHGDFSFQLVPGTGWP